jgi:hypothetical protein
MIQCPSYHDPLAVIDPYGFGTRGTRIDVDRSQIDFGNSHAVGKRWLIVMNRGPRFATLRIETPQWIVAVPNTLRLHAGEQATIELVTRPGWAAQSGALSERIAITDEQGRPVLEVQAEFFVDTMSTNWKPSVMIYISIVVLVLVFALAVRWPFGPVFALTE